jgi:hypothetical protein
VLVGFRPSEGCGPEIRGVIHAATVFIIILC